MSAPTSEEVAADFQDSLNDLQINNRYEISNLTIIAKENIEHAQALSKTLESHIRKVRINHYCLKLVTGSSDLMKTIKLTNHTDSTHSQTSGTLCTRFDREERG